MQAIVTSRLTKFYGQTRGIEGLDLEVETGEVFGFLGPNGAGKSTTIRLLLSLIHPTVGSATVLGRDVRSDSIEIRRRVGYLPGDLHMYEAMTGRQLTQYFSALRGLDTSVRVGELARRLDLDLERTIGSYSTGNRQKVGIVQAFMHDPELLILDEPTVGLDPLMQQEFYRLVEDTLDSGRTVFLSSHILPEVERIAHRVGIVREGRLVAVESIEDLKAKATRRVDITFSDDPDPTAFLAADGVRTCERLDGTSTLRLTVEGSLEGVMAQAARWPITNIVSHEGDLEDAFLAYYAGEDGAS